MAVEGVRTDMRSPVSTTLCGYSTFANASVLIDHSVTRKQDIVETGEFSRDGGWGTRFGGGRFVTGFKEFLSGLSLKFGKGVS